MKVFTTQTQKTGRQGSDLPLWAWKLFWELISTKKSFVFWHRSFFQEERRLSKLSKWLIKSIGLQTYWKMEIGNWKCNDFFINFLWKFSEGKYELHLSAPIKTLAAHQMIKLLQGMHLLFKLRISYHFEPMAEKKHTKKHWSCYLYQALSFTRLVDLNYELSLYLCPSYM